MSTSSAESSGTPNPVLFCHPNGKPMVFVMRPSEERAKLKTEAELRGAQLTNRPEPDSDFIRLIEKDSKIVSHTDGAVHSKYVWDCIEKNQLLNIEDYRVQVTSEEVSDISDLSEEESKNIVRTKARNIRARKEFNSEEDLIIIRHIVQYKLLDDIGGNSIWKAMEKLEELSSHTWQSLKQRFSKQIMPNINNYQSMITPSAYNYLKRKPDLSVIREGIQKAKSVQSPRNVQDQTTSSNSGSSSSSSENAFAEEMNEIDAVNNNYKEKINALSKPAENSESSSNEAEDVEPPSRQISPNAKTFIQKCNLMKEKLQTMQSPKSAFVLETPSNKRTVVSDSESDSDEIPYQASPKKPNSETKKRKPDNSARSPSNHSKKSKILNIQKIDHLHSPKAKVMDWIESVRNSIQRKVEDNATRLNPFEDNHVLEEPLQVSFDVPKKIVDISAANKSLAAKLLSGKSLSSTETKKLAAGTLEVSEFLEYFVHVKKISKNYNKNKKLSSPELVKLVNFWYLLGEDISNLI